MTAPDDEDPSDRELPGNRIPSSLLPISELPGFVEENVRDPFGQNEQLLDAASRRGFELIVAIAGLAHARGLCMMLPDSWPTATIDRSLRPWRSVVPCELPQGDLSVEGIPPSSIDWNGDARETSIPALAQRAMLCVAALRESSAVEAHDQLAGVLEELGYIAIGRRHRDRRLDVPRHGMPWRFFYTIGQIAVRLHDANVIHGDMTSDNFLYNEQAETAMISDVGTICFLGRPITLEEHAADVGLMKLTCRFEEWEALKLGYRELAPERATRLFQLI